MLSDEEIRRILNGDALPDIAPHDAVALHLIRQIPEAAPSELFSAASNAAMLLGEGRVTDFDRRRAVVASIVGTCRTAALLEVIVVSRQVKGA